MAYQIDKKDGIHEIRVWGETSKYEVLDAIRKLDRLNPEKQLPEIWHIAEESQIPFHEYAEVAKAVKALFPQGKVGNRTAIVASGAFHKSLLDLYPAEAADLPFEIRVFEDRDQALAWLKAG